MSTFSFLRELEKRQENFENEAPKLLTKTSWKDSPSPLREAMHYALFSGKSKRIRASLVEEAAQITNLKPEKRLYLALAIEAIHAYSLVHDDLPALDNDTLRRGEPTCHIRFGEDQAILCGDALQALAFELLAQIDCPPQVFLIFAQAIGASGMVGGQSLDLQSQAWKTPKKLKEIHMKKTGQLFAISFSLPFWLTRKNPTLAYRYGVYLGKLFQMVDDLIDVIASSEEVGKKTQKDAEKLTYIRLYGVERTKKMALRQAQRLSRYAQKNFPNSPFVSELPLYITRQFNK